MTSKYKQKIALGAAALLLTLALSGCTGKPGRPPGQTGGEGPGKEASPHPTVNAPATVEEVVRLDLPPGPTGYVEHALSPDGRWAAVISTQDGKKTELWLYSVDQGEGRVIASVSEEDYRAGRLWLRPLGWTQDNELVFARQGTQPEGTHKGQRGLVFFSVQAGDPHDPPQEVAWLPTGTSHVNEVYPDLDRGRVFVHAGKAIWRVSLDGSEPSALRQNLPSYDGLLYPRLSPDGRYFVYELWEPEQSGIYVLDTATGTETCLAPREETMSFAPRWSPDGRYLAYYTANEKKDTSNPYDKYDIILGEDAPFPIAAAIQIASPDGKNKIQLSIPDQKLGYFTWSEDGRHLAFAAGEVFSVPGQPVPTWAFKNASLWVADVEGQLTKVADLGESPLAIISLPAVFPGVPAVYFLTQEEKVNALWLARAGEEPRRLEPPEEMTGYWSGFPGVSFGENLFLTFLAVDYDPAVSHKLVQVWYDQVLPVTEGGVASFLAGRSGRRLAYLQEDTENNQAKLIVFELEE
jgi:Tol biopolymer transport system component